MSARRATLVLLVATIVTLAGCVRGCTSGRPPIHPVLNMDVQPRYDSQAESAFFYDGASMSAPVAGTIARGELIDDSPLFTGKDAAGEFVVSSPTAIAEAMLARGEERFGIYCAPCHTLKGTGKGVLYKVGKVPTPSYREERVVALSDGQIFDVITNGKGLMPPYRWPISAEDRWAIVAHVRRLQEGGRR